MRLQSTLIGALVLLVLSSGAAAPEPRRTATWDGVPFDEIIVVRMGGSLFRIPAGYIWPRTEKRNRVNHQKAIAFEFWMPERRYVELSPSSYVGYRPKEAGRDHVPPDAYVVVVGVQSVALDSPDYLSPETLFRNSIGRAGISAYSFKEEDFGLVRYWPRDPNPELEPRYRHREGTDPQVHLYCTRPLPNFIGQCRGQVHFASDNIGIFLHFPSANLSEWSQIVLAVRDFYRSWKADP